MNTSALVVSPVVVLLVGVALQMLLSRVLSGAQKGWLALAVTVVSTGAVAAMWPHIHDGGVYDTRISGWDGPVSLSFHVDGLALLFAVMATSIGAAILLYSSAYMAKDGAATRFYVIMQVFIAGLIVLVFAADLLLMYAGWEIVGLCSFGLVSFWYTDRDAAAGARKVLVMTHSAGYALLAAILLLYSRAGTTVWTDLRVGKAFTTGIFVLMLVSAVAKSVQFPLHTWIPSAMAAPTPVSALLHAAVYVKAGVYLVARMHSIAPWPHGCQTTVVWLGTVTMVVGVLFAMIQHDAKRLLAFHTVSQIGYMMLGLGLGTPLGVAAALLHTINHGLFKGGLFLGAGAIQHATGTRDMNRLGGLAKRMPTTTALWLINAAGIAGVPLFNGFVSKLLLYVAALKSDYTLPALIAWIVSVLTMFSFMKASSTMFFGGDGEASSGTHESPRAMLVGSGLLAAGCVVLGIAPQLALNYLIDPALTAMGLRGDLGVSWFGFTGSGGSFFAAGLGLAVLSVLVGVLVYRALAAHTSLPATAGGRGGRAADGSPVWAPRELVSAGPAGATLPAVGRLSVPAARTASPSSRRATLSRVGSVGGAGTQALVSEVFTGGEPLPALRAPRASDFSRPVALGLAPFYAWANVDRYYLAVWHGLLQLAGLAQRASAWLERRVLAVLAGAAVIVGALTWAFAGATRTGLAGDEAWVTWPLVAVIGLTLGALLLVLTSSPSGRRAAAPAAGAGLLALAGIVVTAEVPRLVLLEAAAFTAVLALARAGTGSPQDRTPRNAYLGATVLSAAALVTGTLWLDHGPASLVLALLLVGFAIKLALVPGYVWLPTVAERAPAALVGLVVAVVDLAAFAELATLRVNAGWLFGPRWAWLSLALLSVFTGALLALGQRQITRMFAFATISTGGLLILAVTSASSHAVKAAWLLAAADALAMALLFSAVAAAERPTGSRHDSTGDRLTLAHAGVARRHPLAAAAFVAGSLTALGVPFTAGFAGHWRVYAAALDVGGPVLAVLEVSTVLYVLAYARVIALVWWGGTRDEAPLPHEAPPRVSVWGGEPPGHTLALTVLMIAVVVAGLVPALLQKGGLR